MVPGGEVFEFDLEDGGLEGVEAGVPADFVVEVAATHAVGSEHAGALVNFRGRRCQEAGIAEGGEVFGGVEGEGGGVSEGSGGGEGAVQVPGGSEGLGGVFDEEETGGLSFEGGEGVPIGALAVEVDGEDGFDLAGGGGRRGPRLRRRGPGEGEGVDVREEAAGSSAEDGTGAGEEGERRGDDGVAG